MKFAKIALVLIVLLLTSTSLSAKEVKFDWLAEANSELRQLVESVLASTELPTEQTQILTQIDIDIRGDTVIKRVKRILYYPTSSEVNDSGSEVIYWDKEVEKLTILEAGAISQESGYQRIDHSNVRVNDSNTYDTFGDTKEVIIPFSGLRNQSLSVLEYEIRFNRSDLESDWADSFYPVLFNYVRDFKLRVVSDENFNLNWSSSQDAVVCQAEQSTLSCSGKNLEPYLSDTDVVWRDVLGQIFVGETQSWDQVVQRSLISFAKSQSSSSLVAQELNKLVKDEATLDEKINAIHHFVSRDIRYVSMSELGHRFTPHSFESVIRNRFGDCKDKSAMLVSFLKQLGIDAKPVLVATERSDLSQVQIATARYFDHMVVCFTHDGKNYCLDPTDANTHWKSVSSWIQGRISLQLSPGSVPKRLLANKYKWRMSVVSESKFDSEGRIEENQSRTYLGNYAGSWRSAISSSNEKEKQEMAVEQYHSVVSKLVDPKFEFELEDVMSEKFTIKSSADYEPFLDVKQNLSYTEGDGWIRSLISGTKLNSKHYDVETEGIDGNSENILDFGKLWRVNRLPADLNLESSLGSLKRNVKRLADNKISVITRVQIPLQKVKQADIEKFNEFIDLLVRETDMQIGGELVE